MKLTENRQETDRKETVRKNIGNRKEKERGILEKFKIKNKLYKKKKKLLKKKEK